MKKYIFSLIILVYSFQLYSQKQEILQGAYQTNVGDTSYLALFINGYSSFITYDKNSYYATWGGTFQLQGQDLRITVDYDQTNPNRIGTTLIFPKAVLEKSIHINALRYAKQAAHPQDLDGLWQISARQEADQLVQIPQRSRQTLKILVSGYFQWIAIDPEAKGFYGTGGGRYSFDGQNYTEQIDFFSRDNSRIGTQLSFQGKRDGNQWQHSGLSSKGAKLFEIWTLKLSD